MYEQMEVRLRAFIRLAQRYLERFDLLQALPALPLKKEISVPVD
jgi:hypothetical protein